MPGTPIKKDPTIATKKIILKRPKKGSIEAIMKASEEAKKNGLDLSFLKP